MAFCGLASLLSSPVDASPVGACELDTGTCSYDQSNGTQIYQFNKPSFEEIFVTLDVTARSGLYLFFGVNPSLIDGTLDINIKPTTVGLPSITDLSDKRPGDWFLFNNPGTYDLTIQLVGAPGTLRNPYIALDFLPFGSAYPGDPLASGVKHLPIVPVGVAPTPLPSTWILLLGGLIGLGCVTYVGSKAGRTAAALAA